MTRYSINDNATGRLAFSINSTDSVLTITVYVTNPFPEISPNDPPIVLTLTQYATPNDRSSRVIKREKVLLSELLITTFYGYTNLTYAIIERGHDTTVPQSFNAGDYCDINITEDMINGIYQEMDNGNGWRKLPAGATILSTLIPEIEFNNFDIVNIIRKGTKISLYQSTGGTKFWDIYGTSVGTSSVSCRLIKNADYSLTSGEGMTSISISNSDSPQNFPGWIAYGASPIGYTVLPTNWGKYNITGNRCTMAIAMSENGYGNTGILRFPLPAVPATNGVSVWTNRVNDAKSVGVASTTKDFASIYSGGSLCYISKGSCLSGWGSTGVKSAQFNITYKI